MASIIASTALQILLLATSAFQGANCSPVNPGERRHVSDDASIMEKRQGGFFSVLGMSGLGDNGLHPRLEIRELQKNTDQWNVYLLGLRRFQNVAQDDKLSYYQVAGIHGRPYIAWDGVNNVTGGSGGYCAHGSNIFPTWHRPYLALFEELLFLNARQAVSELEDGDLKDRYNQAVSTLRIPYWDSAAPPPSGEGTLPSSVQAPTINIILPNGTTIIDNPLFSYRFHPLNSNDLGGVTPWTYWPTTLRDPSSNRADATSRNNNVASDLDRNRANLQSRVYNILTMQHDYLQISNDIQLGDSIEAIHDTIHNAVGSDGHMSFLAFSAFDPVFWLHHTNIDRMFAIWQALNPNSYVTPHQNPYATFTYAMSSVADVNTPLHPFHRNDAGEFWTSDSVRSVNTFAYTYPELANLNGNDTSGLVNKVNALYGPNATPQKRSSSLDLVDRATSTSNGIAGAPTFSGERQYITNIKVQKFGLDGSFNVYVFIGDDPGADTKQWTQKSCFVGITGILCQPNADQSKAGVEANGAVPLTAALEAKVKSGDLESMKEDVVAKYLKEKLRWRISKINGEEIKIDDVPGFQILVLWAEVKPTQSADDFPQRQGEYQVLVDATDGRPGGFGKNDTPISY